LVNRQGHRDPPRDLPGSEIEPPNLDADTKAYFARITSCRTDKSWTLVLFRAASSHFASFFFKSSIASPLVAATARFRLWAVAGANQSFFFRGKASFSADDKLFRDGTFDQWRWQFHLAPRRLARRTPVTYFFVNPFQFANRNFLIEIFPYRLTGGGAKARIYFG